MEINDLVSFLIERKNKLVQQEKLSIGKVRISIDAQIQVVESILIFISRNKSKEVVDMGELELSLSKPISIEEIRSRQRRRSGSDSIVQAVIKIVHTIPEGQGRSIDVPSVNKRTVASTVHKLVKEGILPSNITVMTAVGGKEIFVVKELVKESVK